MKSREIRLYALGLTSALAAAADSFPSRPVALIVPFPPGGKLCMPRFSRNADIFQLCARLIDQYTFNGFENTKCKNLTFLVADPGEGWIM